MEHIQKHTRPPRGWTRIAAILLAAFSGAAVMVVELGVARILTPVFGGSISVWAIVIATTRAIISIIAAISSSMTAGASCSAPIETGI